MQRSTAQLKLNTRVIMRENRKQVYLASFIFVLLSIIISLLISNLSGTTEYAKSGMEAYTDAYREIEKAAAEYGNIDTVPAERLEEISDGLFSKLAAWPRVTALSYILAAVLTVLNMLLKVGYTGHCLLISRRLDCTPRDIFNSFGIAGKMLTVIILRGILVALGFLLFIVPGFILIYSYRLAAYVVYDNPELGAIECMRKARMMSRGKKWPLFTLDVSFLGWFILDSIVSALLLPIMELWLHPYFGITVAQRYNDLCGYTAAPDSPVIQE